MVHVKKCPHGKRSKPTTEFYHNGKPQIYCMGWTDGMTDEVLEICQKCKDFCLGEQCEKDFEEHLRQMNSRSCIMGEQIDLFKKCYNLLLSILDNLSEDELKIMTLFLFRSYIDIKKLIEELENQDL